MNWWQKTLTGILGAYTLWTSAEIGASAIRQYHEKQGEDILYQGVGALAEDNFAQAQTYLQQSKEAYTHALWWDMAVEKFGLQAQILKLMGKEGREQIPELEFLLELEKFLQGDSSEGNNEMKMKSGKIQLL